MKKVLAFALTLVMVFSLCACGNASITTTTTTTTTTTDADGNSTTTTTTTTTEDPIVTAATLADDGAQHEASLVVANNANADIVALYVALPEDETWGENLLENPIAAGENTADLGWTMKYDKDCLLWQIKADDSEGFEHTFEWDLSVCDGEDMNLEFEGDGEEWLLSFY